MITQIEALLVKVFESRNLKLIITIVTLFILWFIIDRIAMGALERAFKVAEDKIDVNEPEEKRFEMKQRVVTFRHLVTQLVHVVLILFLVLLIMEALGVEVKALIAGLGFIGFGLSFAAQNLIRDYINGAMMIIENQFNVGDWIQIGEYSGTVENFTLRMTKIRDIRGNLIFIPNSQIQILRNSTQKFGVALVELMLTYDVDVAHAGQIMSDIISEMRTERKYGILEEPQIANVNGLTLDSVNIRMRVRTKAGNQWSVEREFRARIKKRFEENGIRFAAQRVRLCDNNKSN